MSATKTPVKVKTAAQIPAEDRAAQQTHFEPAYPIEYLREHPKNIRHHAAADDELLASVREHGILQPLVAYKDPATEGADLIAGHRRLDALRRAGFTHAPVVLRYDLRDEADQVAAMLVENGRRADLTPTEEAEGFDLLAELGWSVEKIAQASGRSKTTVTDRRRLTHLTDKAKTAVDAGQVTIDDALRLAKLPAAEQKKLERYAGTSNFRYELNSVQERVDRQAAVDEVAKKLLKAGVPELEQPKGVQYTYGLNHAEHGMVTIDRTSLRDPADHGDCLAFVRGGSRQYPAIWNVCTDPGKHDDELSAEQAAHQAERDAAAAAEQKRRQEAEERESARKIARHLRDDTLHAAIKANKAIDPTLDALLRITLHSLVAGVGIGCTDTFKQHARIPDDVPNNEIYDWLEQNLHAAATSDLIRTLAALLVDGASSLAANIGRWSDSSELRTARQYFNLLTAVGHEINSVDQELLDTLAELETAAAEGAES